MRHGFPEFWFGWRHQIAPLADAGFSSCRISAATASATSLRHVTIPIVMRSNQLPSGELFRRHEGDGLAGFVALPGNVLDTGTMSIETLHSLLRGWFASFDIVDRFLAYSAQNPLRPVHHDEPDVVTVVESWLLGAFQRHEFSPSMGLLQDVQPLLARHLAGEVLIS
jgi:hypothetical protein